MKRDMSDSIYVTISAGMKGLRPRAHPTTMEDISPVPYAKKKVVIVAMYAGKLDENIIRNINGKLKIRGMTRLNIA